MKVLKEEGPTWSDLEKNATFRNDWKAFIYGL